MEDTLLGMRDRAASIQRQLKELCVRDIVCGLLDRLQTNLPRIQKLSSADRLLEPIEEGIVKHGGDLSGWTRRYDDALQLFDGRITVRAEVNEQEQSREGTVHAHVFATLHEHDDEVLDACLFGAGNDHKAAVAEAAVLWITCVAGPIKSFLDGNPVCMTCQAGVQGGDVSEGFSTGDYGLPGLRAFVGPSISRGKIDHQIQSTLDDTKPWFR